MPEPSQKLRLHRTCVVATTRYLRGAGHTRISSDVTVMECSSAFQSSVVFPGDCWVGNGQETADAQI